MSTDPKRARNAASKKPTAATLLLLLNPLGALVRREALDYESTVKKPRAWFGTSIRTFAQADIAD